LAGLRAVIKFQQWKNIGGLRGRWSSDDGALPFLSWDRRTDPFQATSSTDPLMASPGATTKRSVNASSVIATEAENVSACG
jgi:hypothetical protein